MSILIVDYPNPIREYRKKVSRANDEFMHQLKMIEKLLENINEDSNIYKLVHSKYTDVLAKANELTRCLSDYNNSLYDIQRKFEEIEDEPIAYD